MVSASGDMALSPLPVAAASGEGCGDNAEFAAVFDRRSERGDDDGDSFGVAAAAVAIFDGFAFGSRLIGGFFATAVVAVGVLSLDGAGCAVEGRFSGGGFAAVEAVVAVAVGGRLVFEVANDDDDVAAVDGVGSREVNGDAIMDGLGMDVEGVDDGGAAASGFGDAAIDGGLIRLILTPLVK